MENKYVHISFLWEIQEKLMLEMQRHGPNNQEPPEGHGSQLAVSKAAAKIWEA